MKTYNEEEKINLLLDRGFIAETKIRYARSEWDENDRIPTGRYVLPAWEPEPVVTLTSFGMDAQIGQLTTRITEVAALDKFLDKSVLTFCEKVKL